MVAPHLKMMSRDTPITPKKGSTTFTSSPTSSIKSKGSTNLSNSTPKSTFSNSSTSSNETSFSTASNTSSAPSIKPGSTWSPPYGLSPPPRPASPFQGPTERGPGVSKAEQIYPRLERLLPNEWVAADFEFHDYIHNGVRYMRIGWGAVCNTKLESILDAFARYPHDDNIKQIKPQLRFGVTKDMLQTNNGAIPGRVLEKWLTEIFRGRTVVLHAGGNDRKAWFYEDFFRYADRVVDTQKLYFPFNVGLSNLHAREFPDASAIQVDGRHTPVVDAVSTMELYMKITPYDRAMEKAKLENQGLKTSSRPSAGMVENIKEMKKLHTQAAKKFAKYAD